MLLALRPKFAAEMGDTRASERILQARRHVMPKAYWISTFRSISAPGALASYTKLS